MSIMSWFKQKASAPFSVEEDPDVLKKEAAEERAAERRVKLDESRELSKQRLALSRLETREKELEVQIRVTELEQQLAEIRGDDDFADEEGDNADGLLANLLKGVFLNQKAQSPQVSTPHIIPQNTPSGDSYSDERIKMELDKLNPTQIQIAKKMSDEALREQLINIDSSMSPEAIKKTIGQIRAR